MVEGFFACNRPSAFVAGDERGIALEDSCSVPERTTPRRSRRSHRVAGVRCGDLTEFGSDCHVGGPEGCPNQATVMASIEAMVSATYIKEHGSDVAADAVVHGEPGSYALEARLTRNGVSETKILEAERCETLADAYAVIVSFAIDPASAVRLPGSGPRGAVAAGPTVVPAHAEAAAPTFRAPETMAPAAVQPRAPFGPRAWDWPRRSGRRGIAPISGPGRRSPCVSRGRNALGVAGTFWPKRSSSVEAGPSGAVGVSVGLATVGGSASFQSCAAG